MGLRSNGARNVQLVLENDENQMGSKQREVCTYDNRSCTVVYLIIGNVTKPHCVLQTADTDII